MFEGMTLIISKISFIKEACRSKVKVLKQNTAGILVVTIGVTYECLVDIDIMDVMESATR